MAQDSEGRVLVRGSGKRRDAGVRMVERRGGHYDPKLLTTPQKRIRKKSAFLRKLERMQAPTDVEILNVVPLQKHRRQ